MRRASGGSLDAVKNGCSVLSGGVEGNAEQDGEEDDLQDVAVDEGSDDAGWHAVGEELPPLLALAGSDELVGSVGALDLVGDGVNAVARRKMLMATRPITSATVVPTWK